MWFTYDNTFNGLLSVIFRTYELKAVPRAISSEGGQQLIDTCRVETNGTHVHRVRSGLLKWEQSGIWKFLYTCFLSELPDREMMIYRYFSRVIREKRSIYRDFTDHSVIWLHQVHKKMGREIHRMHAFVRFQETADGKFIALISPDYDVIPLIGKHFKNR